MERAGRKRKDSGADMKNKNIEIERRKRKEGRQRRGSGRKGGTSTTKLKEMNVSKLTRE